MKQKDYLEQKENHIRNGAKVVMITKTNFIVTGKLQEYMQTRIR